MLKQHSRKPDHHNSILRFQSQIHVFHKAIASPTVILVYNAITFYSRAIMENFRQTLKHFPPWQSFLSLLKHWKWQHFIVTVSSPYPGCNMTSSYMAFCRLDRRHLSTCSYFFVSCFSTSLFDLRKINGWIIWNVSELRGKKFSLKGVYNRKLNLFTSNRFDVINCICYI